MHNHFLSLPFNPPVQKLPSMITSLDGLSAGEPSSLSGFFMYSSFSLPFSVQVVLIISVFHGFVKTKKIKIFLGRTETAPWGGRGAERNSESVLTPAFGQERLLCSLYGRTYVSDSHLDAAARPPDREAVPVRRLQFSPLNCNRHPAIENRFAMGWMPTGTMISHGLRSKCADLAEL